jgi:hypothetical protein
MYLQSRHCILIFYTYKKTKQLDSGKTGGQEGGDPSCQTGEMPRSTSESELGVSLFPALH